MAVPLIYVAVAGGRIAYSFLKTPAGRKAAKDFAKNLLKQGKKSKVTNSKPPNVKITQGPRRTNPEKPNQPVNPKTGKFQKPSKTPAAKKPNAPPKKDSKPSNVPSVPKKKPNAMTTSPGKPKRPGDDAKVVGGSKSKPDNRDYSVRNVPRPKPKTSAPAVLRSSTLDDAPEVKTVPPEDKKKKEQDRRTKPKTVAPKKTKPSVKAPPRKGPPTKKKPGKRPPPRPAQGPVTNESFAAAFKRNRADKEPTFTWKGKLYTTRYKEESIAEHKKKFKVEGKYK
tara:strand:+ start:271 stop:1113 length:843 start_codon:yes stop_codon:yes gene_type:complete